MKSLFSIPFLAAVLLPFVSGQSLSNIPQCAQAAAISSLVSTGCVITNYTCFCDDNSWITGLLPVVMQDCDSADFATTVSTAEQLCKSVGVTLSISIPSTGTNTMAPTSTAIGTAASSSAMSSAVVTSTSSGSPVMSSSTGTATTTSASATANSNSTSGLATASWLTLGLAMCPTLLSNIFVFFGYLG